MNAAVTLVAAALALAPMAGSTRTDAYAAGPYTVTVTRVDPVDVGSAIGFAVTVEPADGAGVVAITLPGPGTPARPGRAVIAAGGRSGTYEVTATFPVRGAWVLAIDVAGRAGRGRLCSATNAGGCRESGASSSGVVLMRAAAAAYPAGHSA